MQELDKKYNIIKTIKDDAPFGDINWYTISFLTAENIEQTKMLDVNGFKIYGGYNTSELAYLHAENIKTNNNKHDIYVCQMGKIYSWDDVSMTDEIKYTDSRLDNLEKKRREKAAELKLINEQIKEKNKKATKSKIESISKRMHQKLYERGKISKLEYDMLQEMRKPKENTDSKIILKNLQNSIDDVWKTDYLDETDTNELKYGCISIYSPKIIGGLKTLCLKVRGLFETYDQLSNRIKYLQELFPHERIYQFEVGKWCPYTECEYDGQQILKILNFVMKKYHDSLDNEASEFNNRTEKMVSEANQVASDVKEKQIEKNKKKNKKKKIIKPTIGNSEDLAAIEHIYTYLDDVELRNKYVADDSSLQKMDICP